MYKRQVSFTAPAGAITGLLGPNGTGKSTLLRCMVGLSRADGGTAYFHGQTYEQIPSPPRVVGCLLDASAHHGGRTTLTTVRLAAAYLGLPQADAAAALERVGLSDVAQRRFGALSLGMKQRVGVAIALLGNPSILVLDEPMNGLDVETIHWIRGILVSFARGGGTVVISSHLLHELQVFVDRVVILSGGAVVFEGPAQPAAVAQCIVRGPRIAELRARLVDLGITGRESGPGELLVEATPDVVGDLALAAGIAVHHLASVDGESLEALYLDKAHGAFAPQGTRT